MQDQHKEHEDGIAEIQVEQEVTDQIDELVKAHVAECLRAHIPQDLQDEIATSKRELERLTHSLHNSESRRANADLRSDKPDSLLATMKMAEDGKVSTRYPKDLKELFGLDNNTTLALMSDYDIERSPGSSEIVNLNKFIHFCGVRYQLVGFAAR
ncbi:hypothetical protein CVT24_008456 [Panaeolus cyanescens]|uniref:Uncharacterized protein n=1 Tax=Panaeolus cyanescens TaxID=181874 RepID=A0A409VBZ0_9AGAR|nr:hypothetical protein CVT24_008456 [Panaeolus cyanescens]